MHRFFTVGLIALKIMHSGSDRITGLFVGADRMDGMTDHGQDLKRHHCLIIFHKISNNHENFFLRHGILPSWLKGLC